MRTRTPWDKFISPCNVGEVGFLITRYSHSIILSLGRVTNLGFESYAYLVFKYSLLLTLSMPDAFLYAYPDIKKLSGGTHMLPLSAVPSLFSQWNAPKQIPQLTLRYNTNTNIRPYLKSVKCQLGLVKILLLCIILPDVDFTEKCNWNAACKQAGVEESINEIVILRYKEIIDIALTLGRQLKLLLKQLKSASQSQQDLKIEISKDQLANDSMKKGIELTPMAGNSSTTPLNLEECLGQYEERYGFTDALYLGIRRLSRQDMAKNLMRMASSLTQHLPIIKRNLDEELDNAWLYENVELQSDISFTLMRMLQLNRLIQSPLTTNFPALLLSLNITTYIDNINKAIMKSDYHNSEGLLFIQDLTNQIAAGCEAYITSCDKKEDDNLKTSLRDILIYCKAIINNAKEHLSLNEEIGRKSSASTLRK
jgi:hypothetical protein